MEKFKGKMVRMNLAVSAKVVDYLENTGRIIIRINGTTVSLEEWCVKKINEAMDDGFYYALIEDESEPVSVLVVNGLPLRLPEREEIENKFERIICGPFKSEELR